MQTQLQVEPARFIYALTNRANGRTYYGSTTDYGLSTAKERNKGRYACRARFGDLPKRHAEHIGAMERDDHFNWFVQADFNKGHTDWTFKVLEDLPLGSTLYDCYGAARSANRISADSLLLV